MQYFNVQFTACPQFQGCSVSFRIFKLQQSGSIIKLNPNYYDMVITNGFVYDGKVFNGYIQLREYIEKKNFEIVIKYLLTLVENIQHSFQFIENYSVRNSFIYILQDLPKELNREVINMDIYKRVLLEDYIHDLEVIKDNVHLFRGNKIYAKEILNQLKEFIVSFIF